MLTHDDDGDRAILEMPFDDAAPGDGGAHGLVDYLMIWWSSCGDWSS